MEHDHSEDDNASHDDAMKHYDSDSQQIDVDGAFNRN